MQNEWITSQDGLMVIGHMADRRPAWVWSSDGANLIWRNHAAHLFNARRKKHKVKLSSPAEPIKGQVQRLLRLGAVGQSSLARIRFLSGEKPVAATCQCTPLRLDNGEVALLMVAFDAIDDEVWAAAKPAPPFASTIFSKEDALVFKDEQGQILGASPAGLTALAQNPSFDDADWENIQLSENISVCLFSPSITKQEQLVESSVLPAEQEELHVEASVELGLPEADAPPESADHAEDDAIEGVGEVQTQGHLSGLLDKFSDSAALFEPLGPEDDIVPDELISPEPLPDEAGDEAFEEHIEETTTEVSGDEEQDEPDDDFVSDEDLADLERLDPQPKTPAEPVISESDAPNEQASVRQWRVTGRGFQATSASKEDSEAADSVDDVPTSSGDEDASSTGSSETPTPDDAGDADAEEGSTASVEATGSQVDRVARYNFDELSRILTDRVGSETGARATPPAKSDEPRPPVQSGSRSNAPVNLGDELLVLNRLALGIMIFRDQDILFANREMTDLVGSVTTSELRRRGLDSIFPQLADNESDVGPVAALLGSNGATIPVHARLQTISWQGAPALMLSARRKDAQQAGPLDAQLAAQPATADTIGEDSILLFAKFWANLRSDGFIQTNRAGVITQLSDRAQSIFQNRQSGVSEAQTGTFTGGAMVGRPLAVLISPSDVTNFKSFLEQPAKRAETDRPSLMASTDFGAQITLFAQGRAGMVTGYFGTITQSPARDNAPTRAVTKPNAGAGSTSDIAIMRRLSRNIRQPLNTIVGFSQLLEQQAFGKLENPRYVEYARDINLAGHDITRIVDELDEYARVNDAGLETDTTAFDLAELLEECEALIRSQASLVQVFVRSAISANLPYINADRVSLRQAILNLLASAVDQSAPGGKVILSAQQDPDGTVQVHVRDSNTSQTELADRFMVFREQSGDRDEAMVPMKSSIGLALTRSLIAVNSCAFSVSPSSGTGTLMIVTIPPELRTDRLSASD